MTGAKSTLIRPRGAPAARRTPGGNEKGRRRRRPFGTDTGKRIPLSGTGQIGSIVKVREQSGYVFATLRKVRATESSAASQKAVFESHRVYVDLGFMGHRNFLDNGGMSIFYRGIADFPVPGHRVLMVTKQEMEEIFSAAGADQMRIGTDYPHHKTAAIMLTDHLLSKHFAILGTTGTGKSCTTALILRSILDQHPAAHIVLLDPHNEYATSFGELANQI